MSRRRRRSIMYLVAASLYREMYTVRLREANGRIARRAQFPDVRDALRHMDALVRAFPDLVSEVQGRTGVLFRYEPADRQAAEVAAAS